MLTRCLRKKFHIPSTAYHLLWASEGKQRHSMRIPGLGRVPYDNCDWFEEKQTSQGVFFPQLQNGYRLKGNRLSPVFNPLFSDSWRLMIVDFDNDTSSSPAHSCPGRPGEFFHSNDRFLFYSLLFHRWSSALLTFHCVFLPYLLQYDTTRLQTVLYWDTHLWESVQLLTHFACSTQLTVCSGFI